MAFQEKLIFTKHVLPKALGVVLLLTLIEKLVKFAFTDYFALLINQLASPTWMILLLAFLYLLWALIWPIMITLSILFFIRNAKHLEFKISAKAFLKQNTNQLLIENLRAFGKIFFWSLVLFIPGIIRATQLIFTSFVVVFYERYYLNEIDALKESTRLANTHFFQLLILFVFLSLIPNILVHFFSGLFFSDDLFYLSVGFETFWNTLFYLIFALIIYFYFEKLSHPDDFMFKSKDNTVNPLNH